MTRVSRLLKEHPVKSRVLKRAAGLRCEHCSHEFPITGLTIHFIHFEADEGSDNSDPEDNLLVLCLDCTRSFLLNPGNSAMLEELVRYRKDNVKSAMHRTLCSPTRTYNPPGEFDPEVVFREMIESGSLDLCLNGG